MRIIFVLILLFAAFTFNTAAAQAPTVTITFACSPSGAACTEFLRLTSEALGYPGSGSRMTFVQTQVLKNLYKLAREQKKLEDGNAAKATAESSFNTAYPNEP